MPTSIIRNGDIKFSNQGTENPADIFLDTTGADLVRDPGLQTTIEILLGTEARASKNDVLPSNDSDQKGWWGNELLGFNLGSASWVLSDRMSLTGVNMKAVEKKEQEALQPLIDSGIADSVIVVVSRDPSTFNRMLITGEIIKKDGNSLFFNYFLNWKAELSGVL